MTTTDAAPDAGLKPSADATSELEKRIEDLAPIAFPIGTVAIAAAAGWVQGPGAAVIVLAGGALVGCIAVFWSSLRTLFGETPLSGADAYAIGAPRAEEEQKRAVLRALKDLEFEHGVGKISEEDYQVLVTQYRTEAKRLLRILDDDARPRRAEVEALVERRLKRAGLLDSPEGEPTDEEKKAQDAVAARVATGSVAATPAGKPLRSKKKKAARAGSGPSCASCGTANDADAAFCKKCGARQAPAGATPLRREAPPRGGDEDEDGDLEGSVNDGDGESSDEVGGSAKDRDDAGGPSATSDEAPKGKAVKK